MFPPTDSKSELMEIGEHLHKNISQVYNGLDVSFESFPADDKRDADAYKAAIDALSPGDAITIFTPDPTHYPIALYAIQRKIHVLITKPAVKTLEEHQSLLAEAKKNNVFVFIEHHKRQVSRPRRIENKPTDKPTDLIPPTRMLATVP